MKRTLASFVCFSLIFYVFSTAFADTFGSGMNTFEIEFVPIGSRNNASDTVDGDLQLDGEQHFGSVSYNYRIAKYETAEHMIAVANALGGLNLPSANRGPNKPSTLINWYQATQFVNWLNTSTGHMPAYKFGENDDPDFPDFQLWEPTDPGYDPNNLYRNKLAKYFLPSVDEWYKAAYYNPIDGFYYEFAMGSNSFPTAVPSGTAPNSAVFDQTFGQGSADVNKSGGLSPFGVMGMGGNVREWEETDEDLVNDLINTNTLDEPYRGIHDEQWYDGGSSYSGYRTPAPAAMGYSGVGFRVASIAVPEPNTLLLFVFGMQVLASRFIRLAPRQSLIFA